MSTTLLLADESPTIRRAVELAFAAEGVRVVTAENGEAAIATIKADRPDVVLADIGIRKKSGYEVAAFVKGTPELAGIPVLLLAGAFSPVDETLVEQTGCEGVLMKPFEPTQVVERVRALLAGVHGTPMPAASVVVQAADQRLGPIDLTSLDLSLSGPPQPQSAPSGADSVHIDPPTGVPEVGVPSAPAASRAGPSTDSLDDYFDQLDAAFSARGAGRSANPSHAFDGAARQTAIGGHEQSLRLDPLVTDLAAEAPSDAGRRTDEPSSEAPTIDEAFVDEITNRVAGRLAPAVVGDAVREAVKGLVADSVSEIAERLIREEIARLTKKLPQNVPNP
jgi:twitching motility two-component system response regulator PilH